MKIFFQKENIRKKECEPLHKFSIFSRYDQAPLWNWKKAKEHTFASAFSQLQFLSIVKNLVVLLKEKLG